MKHYLKCNNCGNLNEIKSEYMVLCTSCGKKMENNFTEWQRRNPGKNFEDYRLSVGMAENQLPPEIPKKKNTLKSRPLKEKIFIVIFTVIAASIGSIIGQKAMEAYQNRNKKTKTETSNQQWIKKTYGINGITIETPWELSKMPTQSQMSQLSDFAEYFEMYENSDKESVKVVLTSTKYKPEIIINMQGAADGTINGLKNQKSVSDFIYDEKPYSLDSIPGYIQTGKFKLKGEPVEFTIFGFNKGQYFKQIVISTKQNDANAKETAERIMNSIELNWDKLSE